MTRFFGFSLSFPIFSVSFTMLNVVYDPFLTTTTAISEKNSFMTLFFTLFVLSRASDNTTSQNIWGGRMHGPSPTSNFGGTVPPILPIGLRPWWRYACRHRAFEHQRDPLLLNPGYILAYKSCSV